MGDLENQVFFSLLKKVYESGQRYVGQSPIVMDWDGSGQATERQLSFSYTAMRDRKDAVSHIVVEGHFESTRSNKVSNAKEHAERVGVAKLSDRELLGIFLREEGEERAAELIGKFGSLRGVLAASHGDLAKAYGSARDFEKAGAALSTAGMLQLQTADEIYRRVLLERACERPLLSSSSRLHTFLRATLSNQPREQFRVLFLDCQLQLIREELMNEGTNSHCAVYPREIMRRALELSAYALILVHNHPSRAKTPSWQDINFTQEVVRAANALGIEVCDHLIVAGDSVVSLRKLEPKRFRKP